MNGERVNACDLQPGDRLVTTDGDELEIESVTFDGDRVVIRNTPSARSGLVMPITCVRTTKFVRVPVVS